MIQWVRGERMIITEEKIRAFKKELEKREREKSTAEKYVRDVRLYADYLSGSEATKENAVGYKTHLSITHAPASVNAAVSGLNSFFGFCEKRDMRLKSLKISRRNFADKDREMTMEEYSRLLKVSKRKSERLYLLMQTACSCGLRVSEIRFITCEAVGERKALLISKYCLDAKEYDKNENKESVTWETSTLRQWLNSCFINEAFTDEEKALICDTYLQNPDKPEYGTDGGNDTTDKVFLLSIDETSKYLSDKIVRKAEATDYAKDKGIFVSEENGKSWWWMRSPGSDDLCASCMGNDGFVHGDGQMIEDRTCGVRPAMWVNIGE